MIIRPGPKSIERLACPGGIVIHVYNLAGELLLESRVSSYEDAEGKADNDGAFVAAIEPGDVCIVTFDGDTGERMTWP